MKFSRRDFMHAGCTIAAAASLTPVQRAEAWIHGSVSSAFNGKRLQTNNSLGPQSPFNGAYELINVLKAGQNWAYNSASTGAIKDAVVAPTDLDTNGYLTSTTVSAAQGVYTTFPVPSQQSRPGPYVCYWPGDGTVDAQNWSGSLASWNISAVNQAGTSQTITVDPSTYPMSLFAVGMPLAVTGFSSGNWASGGTWGTGFNATFPITSINTGANQITFNTGVTFTGTATLTSAKITCVFTTTTVLGLNGTGRWVFQPTSSSNLSGGGLSIQQAFFRIRFIASALNYPGVSGDIVFLHYSDETKYRAGQVFTDQYLAAMRYFGVLRNMDWIDANNTNVSFWSHRKPMSYVYYGGRQARPELFCGTETSTSVSSSGFVYNFSAPSAGLASLSDKATVQVKFTMSCVVQVLSAVSDGGSNTILTISQGATDAPFVNTNLIGIYGVTGTGWTALNGNFTVSNFTAGGSTATLTIPVNSSGFTGSPAFGTLPWDTGKSGLVHRQVYANINSLGAKSLSNGLSGPTLDTSHAVIGSGAQSIATLTYDVGLGYWIKFGGCLADGSFLLDNGYPPELHLALCKAVGAHAYYNVPHFAMDYPTDYAPELMQYHKLNAPSWMRSFYEIGNEIWSGTGPTAFANIKAAAYGWSPATYQQWVGMTNSLLGQIGLAIFGSGLGTTYNILCGVQTVTMDGGGNITNNNPRLEFAGYSAPPSVSGTFGTINFSVAAAAPAGGAGPNYVSHGLPATYWQTGLYQYAAAETILNTALGGAEITASSIVNGVLTIGSPQANQSSPVLGQSLQVGMTIFGNGLPNSGVTLVSGSGNTTGSLWTLSDLTINKNYLATYYACVDPTQLDAYLASASDLTLTVNISGTSMTVLSGGSQNTIPINSSRSTVYGGTSTLVFTDRVGISSGTYPNYVLNKSGGTQTGVQVKVGTVFTVEGLANLCLNTANFFNSHGVKKMTAYEGEYSPDYASSSPSSLNFYLRAFAKFATGRQALSTQVYDNFRGVGIISYPSGFTAEFPSVYVATGNYPTTKVWSVLEDIYQTPDPPGWLAIKNYN